MVGGKPVMRYRCVEVMTDSSSCDAARSLRKLRLLSVDALRLPLATCDRPSDCNCTYRHFDDRRQGPRRERKIATLPFVHKGPEQRKGRGRRDSDYE